MSIKHNISERSFRAAYNSIKRTLGALENSPYRQSKSFHDVVKNLEDCLFRINADEQAFIEEITGNDEK